MVEFRAVASVFAGNTRGKKSNFKTELSQQRRKCAVQLVAEAAAAAFNDLADDRFLIADDFSPQGDVEIFEGNGKHVRAMKRAQRFRGGRSGPGVGNAIEIGEDIHIGDQHAVT